jgi:hypothetical protein
MTHTSVNCLSRNQDSFPACAERSFACQVIPPVGVDHYLSVDNYRISTFVARRSMIADNRILLYHAPLAAAANKVITPFFFYNTCQITYFLFRYFVSLIVTRPFQMSLNQKFKEALFGLTTSVSALRLDER